MNSFPLATAGPTDATLVERVRAGDLDAYTLLVNRHQAAIYRHARGMGLDHDTSLDLVQEAFIRAWDRLVDCRDGAHYRSWLFRICRNMCLDELRDVRRKSVPMSDVEYVDSIEDPDAVPDDVTLVLRAALERLPTALREAFLLKHDAGYTYEEIAVIADASPSAVKMRVHRARETLRAFLVQQGVSATAEFEQGSDNEAPLARLSSEDTSDRRSGASRRAARVANSRRIS